MKKKFIILALTVIYIIAMALLGITICPFKRFTGYPCPACGATRAYLSLLKLDFKSAFYYHPLFPILLPMVIYILFGKRPLFKSEKNEKVFLVIFAVIIAFVWIYRLLHKFDFK